MNDCTHRQRRLVISLPVYVYQIQCVACFLTGSPATSGIGAYRAWIATLNRLKGARAA